MALVKNREEVEAKIQQDFKEYQRQNAELANKLKADRDAKAAAKKAADQRISEERKRPSAEQKAVDEYKPRSVLDKLLGR